jgi:hypothetical protein
MWLSLLLAADADEIPGSDKMRRLVKLARISTFMFRFIRRTFPSIPYRGNRAGLLHEICMAGRAADAPPAPMQDLAPPVLPGKTRKFGVRSCVQFLDRPIEQAGKCCALWLAPLGRELVENRHPASPLKLPQEKRGGTVLRNMLLLESFRFGASRRASLMMATSCH